eukprot:1140786-Pelagomonas_calceolata.AAC.2
MVVMNCAWCILEVRGCCWGVREAVHPRECRRVLVPGVEMVVINCAWWLCEHPRSNCHAFALRGSTPLMRLPNLAASEKPLTCGPKKCGAQMCMCLAERWLSSTVLGGSVRRCLREREVCKLCEEALLMLAAKEMWLLFFTRGA